MPNLLVEGVCFSYGSHLVLQDVSIATVSGKVTALLGPNGSGKSTLLKIMLGLYRPTRGAARLDGRDLWRIPRREISRQIAYVPQVHREGFAYTVGDVVLMGRMPHTAFLSGYDAADHRAACDAIEALGIGHLAECPYTQVSGGERQLTLIARALAQGARTLLMDEPTGGLDYGNQIRLLEQIGALARQGFTFLFSTHHPDHALAVADEVVLLRDGKIVDRGPPASSITSETLSQLYSADVRVLTVGRSVSVCVPAMRLASHE
jgi:iron complex transport system ATP-binding protein